MPLKHKSLRETLIENQRGLDAWARMHGKEPTERIQIAPKRKRAAPKPSGIPSEHQEQVAFVKWFHMQHKGVRLFAIPNAARRSPQLAAYLKAEGMSSGVPDLCIPAWRMWIEFKRVKDGVISPEQKDWHDYLRGIGDTVIVAYGFDDAVKKINVEFSGGAPLAASPLENIVMQQEEI